MVEGKHVKRTIRILVKAFPQPSTKHEETVCCAGINEDTGELRSPLDPAEVVKQQPLF